MNELLIMDAGFTVTLILLHVIGFHKVRLEDFPIYNWLSKGVQDL